MTRRFVAALAGVFLFLLGFAPIQAHEYHRAAVDSLPSEIPDRVVLTWSGDPATTASVTWRTSTDIMTGEGQIAFADASANFTTWAEKAPAITEKWQRNDYAMHFHSVTFKNLKPNTIYAYRVGGGDNFSAGLISSLLEGKAPQDTIDFAGAYSALAHTFPGDVNWATRSEAESAMKGEAARIKR